MVAVKDFKAFPEDHRVARVLEATAAGTEVRCGWVPPDERPAAVIRACELIEADFPAFGVRGRWQMAERRYCLWAAVKQLLGRHLDYNWQQTGSCVGAGGDNAARTGMAVEIVLKGEREELLPTWWPFTYGRSRHHSGFRGSGEGSTGTGWAKAAVTDGSFEMDPKGMPDLPDFTLRDGWRVQPGSVEMKWSNGGAIAPEWVTYGQKHRWKTAARLRSAAECVEALANGYAITQASDFGFSGPRVRGTKHPIRVAEWNGRWSHQTYVDEVWDHPELNGIFFRWGNNWGPKAHGDPTGDEPPGGVYIEDLTMDRICKTGEVYAFSAFDGFPAREEELRLEMFRAFR